jgi:nicotinamidase-related amidase
MLHLQIIPQLGLFFSFLRWDYPIFSPMLLNSARLYICALDAGLTAFYMPGIMPRSGIASRAIHIMHRISEEKKMGKPYVRLDKDNAAVLLVDHQTGLLSLVRDIDPDKFKNNVLALAAAAKYFNLPTILTTSFEQGPNGPLVPELKELFPDAPYIARPGQINAWDNEDFVKAVKATGKKQLIIAGVVTEVCVAFPTLSALAEDFDVFVITDASGTFNHLTRDSAWERMSQAGAQLMTWFGAACELHRDWRNDIEGLGALFGNHIPDYRNLINSYTQNTAQK